jgi:hypothetical protein
MPSVQFRLNAWLSTNWNPFVTSINMNGAGGTNDCINYINRLAHFASNSPSMLFISADARTYWNTNWYFNDPSGEELLGYQASLGVLAANPSASIIYTNGPNNISKGTNVAGYFSYGYNGGLGGTYPTDGTVTFATDSGWFIIETDESFNGKRITFQGNFLQWFSSNAFGGLAYSNTPIGAVSQVDEPGTAVNYPYTYFGLWASGKIFANCARNSFYNYGTPYPQMIGDPFTKQ